MDDLISRLSDLRSQYSCFSEGERDAYHTLSEAIEALKEQRTGEWILSFNGYENTLICSECGEEYVLYDGVISEQHYCPNCGSRMENGGEDD